ncbi:cobalt ABC transporter substrate-binding protein [Herbaspirillum sp. NPDC087042]|uniref:cobalt ABC transporter substrate-binding protein n=1 Tax=Herbaspirillum sp. NPDC087042 TaxID=3364004 RepID=UPI0037F6C4D8
MKRLAIVSGLLTSLMLALPASAHQVWLQQDGKEAKLYFGEFGENLREASPGLLDKFVSPSAVLISAQGDRTLELSKGADAFRLAVKAGKGESIVAEDAHYPVFENKHANPVVRTAWTPAARLVTSDAAQEPRLTLDLLPTGKPGQFKVSYKNAPLPKAKVGLVTPSGWMKEAYSDAQGLVQFELPWQGTYVAEVHHTDKSAGERDGHAYDTASFVTTLSLVQSKGLKALPAAPAAKPNK